MNEETCYPKFQWSLFVGGNKDQQFVVRADNAEELRIGIEAVKLMVPHKETPPVAQTTTQPTTDPRAHWCPVHDVAQVWKAGTSKEGKPYGFYACPMKAADGTWCKGKLTPAVTGIVGGPTPF